MNELNEIEKNMSLIIEKFNKDINFLSIEIMRIDQYKQIERVRVIHKERGILIMLRSKMLDLIQSLTEMRAIEDACFKDEQ